MRRKTVYVVVNKDESIRLLQRIPPRGWGKNDCAISVVIEFPDGWGKQIGKVEVEMPDTKPVLTNVTAQVKAKWEKT